jgi:type VI secretion system protein ImpK
MSSSTHVSPLGSYRGSSSAMDRRGWNLALSFQEVFTAIVRLRSRKQDVPNAEAFRGQMKQALRAAEQEAVSRGYVAEDVHRAIFVIVAFLDESALGSRNPAFSEWPRLPLQAELFGHQLAGEVVFQELQKVLSRPDSSENTDLLEVFYLCLLLGFQGKYAAGGRGELTSIMAAVQQKIQRVRGSFPLSPRGGIPADAVRLTHADPWIRRLAIGAVIALILTVALFLVLKFSLVSGISEVSTLAAQLHS